MLDKKVIMNLLKNSEYTKIVNIFEKEYRGIMIQFLLDKNIPIVSSSLLVDIMMKIETKFPEHKGLMKVVNRTLFSEDVLTFDRIESLIDNYKILRKRLT